MGEVKAMRVQWVVDGVFGSDEIGYQASLASNRYRAILPAQALKARGVDVQFVPMSRWDFAAQTLDKADVIVIGKLAPGVEPRRLATLSERVLNAAQQAVQAGIAVVADFNDDHFDRPTVGNYWRTLAQICSLGVVGSDDMQRVLSQYSSRPAVVIGDPTGSPRGDPQVFRTSRQRWLRWPGSTALLNLIWYGNLNNWMPMQAWLDRMVVLAEHQPWLLRLVTTRDETLLGMVEQFNEQHGPRARLEFVEWNEAEQWRLVAASDAVLIPSDLAMQKKVVKTGNRLTDALHAGRYVVASPLPAYLPYADCVTLTDDPVAALQNFVAEPEQCLNRLVAGQTRVLKESSAEKVGGLWLGAFQQALNNRGAPGESSPPRALGQSGTRVKLNLGCGDKILPGFINVDVVTSRAGKEPDVICDLRELTPFADGSVDEVMAIHVVEHFWRWEIESVLREWLRVLKPGGLMILECPNLLTACQELLADPVKRSRQDGEGQRSMWVFYGDPAWKDPLMIHRWGYTPQSLAELMRDVGMMNVRQEPAQFKLREPRDMRIVAVKP